MVLITNFDKLEERMLATIYSYDEQIQSLAMCDRFEEIAQVRLEREDAVARYIDTYIKLEADGDITAAYKHLLHP